MIRKFNVNVTQSKRFEVVMMGSRGGHRSRTSSALFTRFVYVWILIIFFFFIFEDWKKLACDWHKYWNDDKFKYSECQTARKFDSLVSFRLMNVSKCGLQCLQQSSFFQKNDLSSNFYYQLVLWLRKRGFVAYSDSAFELRSNTRIYS